MYEPRSVTNYTVIEKTSKQERLVIINLHLQSDWILKEQIKLKYDMKTEHGVQVTSLLSFFCIDTKVQFTNTNKEGIESLLVITVLPHL